jgi:hypothetical protein
MRKNSGEIFQPLQVDPISGEYEDTEIRLELSANEIILSERK